MMNTGEVITAYQAKYIAHELTLKLPSGSSDRLNAALMDAQVDLNPHQVDAALFAFRSPLSKGAILADEVGLGKTIEAGILLAQLWAEKKRRLLIICPANLRKQWSQELQDKFYLPSKILEAKSFRELKASNKRKPFELNEIVIVSYQFAASKQEDLALVDWDLAVIDEAHRLRNSYKPNSRIGNALKSGLRATRKVLLTATPLQNSLMELFGLVGIIDDKVFGDEKNFRKQFARVIDGETFDDLKSRLKPICIRNLRRQVQEYIKYTKRKPITIKFKPTAAEQHLYDQVAEYLQREVLYALPSSQRHFTGMILRKLMASSSFALAGTLTKIINRLEADVKQHERTQKLEELADEYELFDEQEEEWEDETENPSGEKLSEEDIANIRDEVEELKRYRDQAQQIHANAKGDKLLEAIKTGFDNMQPEAPKKAIIFTESTRTQLYLKEILEKHFPDGIVLFNGSNTDPGSQVIYQSWLDRYKGTDKITGSPTADKRAALVEHFREHATIMIATEAAAEGINLQFCSLIVNYDLPWNPQRIEQRIGRCHRYGQKYDVVVVNFLNVDNAADVRVFQLLEQKFKLFDGVFGASDEVLGSIESGVDFEKRIADIYRNCRSMAEIEREFDALQDELADVIDAKMQKTREQLFENLDQEVLDRLKIRLGESREALSNYEKLLWDITKYRLQDYAVFHEASLSFDLKKRPFEHGHYDVGVRYKIGKETEGAIKHRLNGELAQLILADLTQLDLPVSELTFNLSGHTNQVIDLEPLLGSTGWLAVSRVAVSSFEQSDYLIYAGLTEEGEVLTDAQAQKLLKLKAKETSCAVTTSLPSALEDLLKQREKEVLANVKQSDIDWYIKEDEKLDKWAEDRKAALSKAIEDAKARLQELKRESRSYGDLAIMFSYQEKIKEQEGKIGKMRREIYELEEKIDQERDSFMAEIKQRMNVSQNVLPLWSIKWRVV